MYSLVIAEDEFTTRRALVNMVRWNELGFRKESGVILILEKICGCPIGKAWKWDTTIMTDILRRLPFLSATGFPIPLSDIGTAM